ncbi:Uncharacterised protein [Escherichia coli]|nr:Uncharacterised protein [Escherichia coli]
MIIITLHNFSPDFSNTRFNHQEQSWSPPCVILLKVKLTSVTQGLNHQAVYGLHLGSSYLK